MNDLEVTALARELADELYNDDRAYNSILWWYEEPKERKAEELEHTLRFLLRRYALVDKENVRKWIGAKLQLPKIRERVLICERVANQYKVFIGKRVPSPCPDGWEWSQSTKENVVAWMPLPQYTPDLGKEVEEERAGTRPALDSPSSINPHHPNQSQT